MIMTLRVSNIYVKFCQLLYYSCVEYINYIACMHHTHMLAYMHVCMCHCDGICVIVMVCHHMDVCHNTYSYHVYIYSMS